MIFRALADFTVLVHFIWILFLIAGGIWGRKYANVKTIHLLGLAFAIFLQAMGWYCPLTNLEVWLRQMAEPGSGYEGSFIVNYVEKLVYLELSRTAVSTLTLILCAFNVWLYSWRALKKGFKRLLTFVRNT